MQIGNVYILVSNATYMLDHIYFGFQGTVGFVCGFWCSIKVNLSWTIFFYIQILAREWVGGNHSNLLNIEEKNTFFMLWTTLWCISLFFFCFRHFHRHRIVYFWSSWWPSGGHVHPHTVSPGLVWSSVGHICLLCCSYTAVCGLWLSYRCHLHIRQMLY